jgi:hypothetical protein
MNRALKEMTGMEATQETAVASPSATPSTEPEEGEIRGGASLAAGASAWPPVAPLPAASTSPLTRV